MLYTDGTRLSISYNQVRQENKNISFPIGEYPEVAGYIRYRPTDRPSITESQKVTESTPSMIEGEYVQVWSVVNLNEQELSEVINRKKDQLRALVTENRRNKENGFILFGNIPIATDSVSQSKMLGVYVMALSNPEYQVRWKANDGTFHTFNASQIMSMSIQVRDYIQSVFDEESDFYSQIEQAETLEDLAVIEASLSNEESTG